MSTNAWAIYAKDLNDKINGVKCVYVHWDGDKHLRDTLQEHYANNEAKLDLLFSEGYASDVYPESIERRNNEPEIKLNCPIFLKMVLEEQTHLSYIHVIKNGKVTMFKYSKSGIQEAVDAVFNG